MKSTLRTGLIAGLVLAFPAALTATAQANVIPGTDVSLGFLDSLTAVGRDGNFPGGMNALAMSTTSCNKGTVDVPWLQPMDEDHPFMGFLIVRYDDSGRMTQVSNYSYVKHGFFALASSQCDSCTVSPFGHDGTYLGIGCSDTYAVNNNSNNYYLGPAEEIDPWLGDWDATCSLFDAGLNPTPETMCDGIRDYTSFQASTLGPIGNRVHVPDAAFSDVGNPEFAYSSYYVIRGEPEGRRGNNLGSKTFNPFFNGSNWIFQDTSPLEYGSVLERWPGARVESETNALDDGRVYVSSSVTGPDADGLYHYEYALHNRDNNRAIDELRIPLCASAGVSGFGFKDIDLDLANDWTATRIGDELVYSTANNPLRWNSIFNFWFDSTAAPSDGAVSLGQFFAGPGADSFAVAADVPGTVFEIDLGPGCASGTAPTVASNGQATLGNSAFALELSGVAPNAPTFLLLSTLSTSLPVGSGCTLYLGGSFGAQLIEVGSVSADGSGVADYTVPVPSSAVLEGVDLTFQGFELAAGAPAFGVGNLTNGLLVRVGNDTTGCGQ